MATLSRREMFSGLPRYLAPCAWYKAIPGLRMPVSEADIDAALKAIASELA